ncbi:PSP proline-rich [Trinorchestia longiramus]|nr:PSP proline-rich [Trinorchestia longiramus]
MANQVPTKNERTEFTESLSDSGIASQTASNASVTHGSSSDDFITLDDSEQFTLSTNGGECSATENDAQDDNPEEIICIPKYTPMFTDFLTVQEFSMETGQPVVDARPKRTCFNCLGDHNVSDCKEALNYSKIAKNRRAYQDKKPASSFRYHELASNKYGHFTPGILSPALRHALGCRDYQQSELVYRMRLLGYPPGWLMEASEQQGELALYGSDGRAVAMVDGEEGEVSGIAKYRPEKLIEFPGFNSPLPVHFREESHLYNLPAIQAIHCVNRWREIMNENKVTPYKKRKMRPNDTDNSISSVDLTEEIHVESDSSSPEVLQENEATARPTGRAGKRRLDESPEEGEVLSDDEAALTPSKRPKLSDEKTSPDPSSNACIQSNTTIDLSEDSTQEGATLDSSNIQFTIDLEPSLVDEESTLERADQSSSSKKENDLQSSCNNDRLKALAADDDDTDPGTPDSSSTPTTARGRARSHVRAASKGFVLGAVLPNSISPFSSLPHPDKWTVDVTDHILFENLPDALGTWKNMKDLMKKVKTKVTELHADED